MASSGETTPAGMKRGDSVAWEREKEKPEVVDLKNSLAAHKGHLTRVIKSSRQSRGRSKWSSLNHHQWELISSKGVIRTWKKSTMCLRRATINYHRPNKPQGIQRERRGCPRGVVEMEQGCHQMHQHPQLQATTLCIWSAWRTWTRSSCQGK